MRFVLYALENESKLDFSLYAGNKKDTIVDGEWKIIKVHPNINLVWRMRWGKWVFHNCATAAATVWHTLVKIPNGWGGENHPDPSLGLW